MKRIGSIFMIGLAVLLAAGPGAIAKQMKIMLLVDEKNLGTIPTAEVESLGVRLLLDEGLQVVDQEMVRANVKKDQQLLKMAGDARGAAALGLQFGADVVIMGDAVAKPSAQRIGDSNLRTYQAVVTLRAVRTDNSETVASASEVGTAIGLEDVGGSSKALKTAGQKSLDSLIPTLMDAMGLDGKGPWRVAFTFGGCDQAWKVKALRKSLEQRRELSNVEQLSYSAGAATFEADTNIPAKDLSEELVLSPPKGLKLQVLDVARGKINMRVFGK